VSKPHPEEPASGRRLEGLLEKIHFFSSLLILFRVFVPWWFIFFAPLFFTTEHTESTERIQEEIFHAHVAGIILKIFFPRFYSESSVISALRPKTLPPSRRQEAPSKERRDPVVHKPSLCRCHVVTMSADRE
jgi:hypothetical protein